MFVLGVDVETCSVVSNCCDTKRLLLSDFCRDLCGSECDLEIPRVDELNCGIFEASGNEESGLLRVSVACRLEISSMYSSWPKSIPGVAKCF